jgi:hypothetical protein
LRADFISQFLIFNFCSLPNCVVWHIVVIYNAWLHGTGFPILDSILNIVERLLWRWNLSIRRHISHYSHHFLAATNPRFNPTKACLLLLIEYAPCLQIFLILNTSL